MVPKPGDKVMVNETYNSYNKGETYTLHFKYMDNGVWKKYNVGDTDSSGKENLWETEEHMAKGIEEKHFEVVG